MGCFNATCNLSGLPITAGTKVYVMFLRRAKHADLDMGAQETHSLAFPLFQAEYNDYGWFEEAENTSTTRALLEYLQVEDFAELYANHGSVFNRKRTKQENERIKALHDKSEERFANNTRLKPEEIKSMLDFSKKSVEESVDRHLSFDVNFIRKDVLDKTLSIHKSEYDGLANHRIGDDAPALRAVGFVDIPESDDFRAVKKSYFRASDFSIALAHPELPGYEVYPTTYGCADNANFKSGGMYCMLDMQKFVQEKFGKTLFTKKELKQNTLAFLYGKSEEFRKGVDAFATIDMSEIEDGLAHRLALIAEMEQHSSMKDIPKWIRDYIIQNLFADFRPTNLSDYAAALKFKFDERIVADIELSEKTVCLFCVLHKKFIDFQYGGQEWGTDAHHALIKAMSQVVYKRLGEEAE